jgi:hypothetical protein
VGAESAATGERGFVGTKGGDMYAGKDGEVYRRNDDGWQKNSNGEWNNVSASERTGERTSPSRERSSTSSETMQGLQQDAKSRDRGQTTSRQASQASRGSRGGGGRGGRR